ncbi:DUF2603 domain-containing protein [Helicobacter sp. MIT 99-5507]|uniref:DUF2603 domain-containing protein n=1 Tax=Helicobacter sp. MIT 99-5507 TaxID=152489 RepID=UPI0015F19D1F|nr:DUF2603 domain-containing protein [Helicobacter sp. MIT 99-5507]
MEKIDTDFTITIKKSSLQSTPYSVKIGDYDYVLLLDSEYRKMQEIIKINHEALMFKSLEKEILQEMPRDFDDVFIVAKTLLKSIQSKKKNLTIYDIKKVVKEIKINYPNLFINIDEYFKDMNINS